MKNKKYILLSTLALLALLVSACAGAASPSQTTDSQSAATVTTDSTSVQQNQPANVPAQNGSPNNACQPDLTTAAATLGISADELQSALGDPAQGQPDLSAAAAQLGVTADALQQAMQQANPSNCTPPNGQGGQNDPNNACRPDIATAAATLGVTSEALQSALGDVSQGRPDMTTAASTLGISADALQQAMQQAMPANCAPQGGPGNGQMPPPSP